MTAIERVEEWLKAPSVQTWPDIADIRALVAAARRAEEMGGVLFEARKRALLGGSFAVEFIDGKLAPRKAKKGRSERR